MITIFINNITHSFFLSSGNLRKQDVVVVISCKYLDCMKIDSFQDQIKKMIDWILASR